MIPLASILQQAGITDDDVGMEIFFPRYEWDRENDKFHKLPDVVVTRDREDPSMIILDLGGDIGEVFFKVNDLIKAVRILVGN